MAFICVLPGGRLCALGQVYSSVSSGCSFNGQRVWSQTPCGEDSFYAVTSSSWIVDDYVCKHVSESFPIRCCMDECPEQTVRTLPQVSNSCCESLPSGAWPSSGMNKHPKTCGTSEGCKNMTWMDAYDHCEGIGGSLCHAEEVIAAKGTGCSFNSKEVWTQTSCCTPSNLEGMWTMHGNGMLLMPEFTLETKHEVGTLTRERSAARHRD